MYAECLHQLHADIVAMSILIQMRPGLSLSLSRNYVLLFDLYASYLVFSATASSSSSVDVWALVWAKFLRLLMALKLLS
jgi:hypothetical protein